MSPATRYRLVCVAAGLAAAWIPFLLHGPIPEKLARVRLNGPVAVWGWYVARMLIGIVVAAATWPRPWWLRGALFGALVMLPPAIVSLATPGCGPDCASLNVGTGALVGVLAGGGARLVTGRDHA
ncbi:MAG TPA: hypothetical protein VIS07_10020 [Candidatus Binatia bacterium]